MLWSAAEQLLFCFEKEGFPAYVPGRRGGIFRLKSCLAVGQQAQLKAPAWPGGRTRSWKISFVSKIREIWKVSTAVSAWIERSQSRGCQWWPRFWSQSSLLGGVGPASWAPARLYETLRQSWEKVQEMVSGSHPCHRQRGLPLSCCRPECGFVLLQSSATSFNSR